MKLLLAYLICGEIWERAVRSTPRGDVYPEAEQYANGLHETGR